MTHAPCLLPSVDPVASIDIAGDSTHLRWVWKRNRAAMIYGITRPINYPLMKVRLPPAASHYSFLTTAMRSSKPATLKPVHWMIVTLY